MRAPDGSMTFDWIFFAIVAIPWFLGLWELRKSYKGEPKSKMSPNDRESARKL